MISVESKSTELSNSTWIQIWKSKRTIGISVFSMLFVNISMKISTTLHHLRMRRKEKLDNHLGRSQPYSLVHYGMVFIQDTIYLFSIGSYISKSFNKFIESGRSKELYSIKFIWTIQHLQAYSKMPLAHLLWPTMAWLSI